VDRHLENPQISSKLEVVLYTGILLVAGSIKQHADRRADIHRDIQTDRRSDCSFSLRTQHWSEKR